MREEGRGAGSQGRKEPKKGDFRISTETSREAGEGEKGGEMAKGVASTICAISIDGWMKNVKTPTGRMRRGE